MIDSLINTLLVIAGLYVYLSLLSPGRGAGNGAAALGEPGVWRARSRRRHPAYWLVCAQYAGGRESRTRGLFRRAISLSPAAFSLAVVASLTALLQLRGFSVLSLGGFSRLGFRTNCQHRGGSAFRGLSAAFRGRRHFYAWLLGEGSSKQQIVEMFTGSETLQQRVLIIVLAITIAPFAEEFIFRFFLYGVLKRYLGRGAGLVLNSLLFAAVHVHLPSLGRSLFSADVSPWPMNGAAPFSSR